MMQSASILVFESSMLLTECMDPNHISVSQEPSGKTMHSTAVEGPLNCLAVNRDCSQVVVAGRNGK